MQHELIIHDNEHVLSPDIVYEYQFRGVTLRLVGVQMCATTDVAVYLHRALKPT